MFTFFGNFLKILKFKIQIYRKRVTIQNIEMLQKNKNVFLSFTNAWHLNMFPSGTYYLITNQNIQSPIDSHHL